MESFTLQSTYKIHSGYEIPIVGLGVSYNPFINLMDPKFPRPPNCHLYGRWILSLRKILREKRKQIKERCLLFFLILFHFTFFFQRRQWLTSYLSYYIRFSKRTFYLFIENAHEMRIMRFLTSWTGLRPPDVTEKVVLKALDIGYRHVRCPYFNALRSLL